MAFCRYVAVLCVITALCLPRAVRASHATDYGAIGFAFSVASVAAGTVPLPVNLILAHRHQGEFGVAAIGIGSGITQIGIGTLYVARSAVSGRKAFGGAAIALGGANIGAAIFALSRRGSPQARLQLGALSSNGVAPGITFIKRF